MRNERRKRPHAKAQRRKERVIVIADCGMNGGNGLSQSRRERRERLIVGCGMQTCLPQAQSVSPGSGGRQSGTGILPVLERRRRNVPAQAGATESVGANLVFARPGLTRRKDGRRIRVEWERGGTGTERSARRAGARRRGAIRPCPRSNGPIPLALPDCHVRSFFFRYRCSIMQTDSQVPIDSNDIPFLPNATDISTLARIGNKVQEMAVRDVWWRGHACCDWQLVPHVFRNDKRAANEKNLMLRFITKAATRHEDCPDPSDGAGWMFLMQHYGLPTRLLDWSESILVAAYFASTERLDQDGEIWSLLPYHLNNEQLGSPELPLPYSSHVRRFFEAAFGKATIDQDEAVAVVPLEADVRMLAQCGTYTIHSSNRPMDQLPHASKYLMRVPVPAKTKQSLAKELWNVGIRRSNLFPDLQNLAAELKERSLHATF